VWERLPRSLAVDIVIYYKRKSKPLPESLEQWDFLAESWKEGPVLGSVMLSRLGKAIVSAEYDGGLFDSLFTNIGGNMA